MKDPQKLKNLVIEKVDLTEVMISYSVEFSYHNPRALPEAQFKCPFHGKDNKPSARLYKATKSCWCWVCHKSWDVIRFVQDKESLTWTGALLYIIDKWHVDTSVIPDAPVLDLVRPKPAEISSAAVRMETLNRHIRSLRGRVEVSKYAAIVTAWLMIVFENKKGIDPSSNLSKLEIKVDSLCQ